MLHKSLDFVLLFDIGNKPAKHVINTILCGHVYERVPWGTIA